MTIPARSARRHARGEPWITIGVCLVSAIVGVGMLFAASIVMFPLAQPCPIDMECTEPVDLLVLLALMWVAPAVLGLAGMVTGIVLVVRRRRGWAWAASLVGAGTLCWAVGLVLAIVALAADGG